MTMREKMARAMCAGFVERRSKGDSYAFKADWDAMQPVMQEFWLRFADAALDALMEPTTDISNHVVAEVRGIISTAPAGTVAICVEAYLRAAKDGK